MNLALLIDFGSTYTKLRAVDLDTAAIIASGQGPSTVTTDVNIGLDAALADLESHLGRMPAFRHRLASSSAAGGLAMTTIGLVPELTAKAARLAALGAGAKVAGTYAFELTGRDVDEIVTSRPDIVLLCGGTDGGNRDVIAHNGRQLAQSALGCPVVVAGNRSVADEIAEGLRRAGKPAVIAGNVMPRHLELDIEPARHAIRRLFIERIVHAKGIDRAQARFDSVLMPTPAAVLEGARLIADGLDGQPGLGPLLVVDIGGSTTDVHSVCSGEPTVSGVVYHGLREPYTKRTVEGDLGMRHTARSVVAQARAEHFATAADIDAHVVEALLTRCDRDVEWLPGSEEEHRFDEVLAREATRASVTRHAGTHETVYTATGPATMQRGKDLGTVETVIGTGGVLVHGRNPAKVLAAALASADEPLSLRPRAARLALDADYTLYAVGLLGTVDPAAALRFGIAGLKTLDFEREEYPDHDATASE